MQNCGIGYSNLVLSARLSASAEAALLPVANLKSQQGADAYAWRVPALTATLTLDLAAPSAVRVVSVHRANLTGKASVTLTASLNGTVVWSGSPVLRISSGQAIAQLPASVTVSQVQVTFSDPQNTDGYLSIPLLYIGDLWQPVRNFSTSSTSSFGLGVDEVTALSGSEYPAFRWIRRTLSIAHQSYGAAEVPTLQSIQRIAATGTNILFLPDPDADTLAADAVFGRLSGGEIGNPFGAADRRSWQFTLTERL